MKKIIILIVLFVTLFNIGYSYEEEKHNMHTENSHEGHHGKEEGLSLEIGAFTMIKSNLYKGADNEIKLEPYINFKMGRVEFEGESLNISLFNKNNIQLALHGRFYGIGYESSDSKYLKGMKKRNLGFFAGLQCTYESEFLASKITLINENDITGDSNGSLSALKISKVIELRENLFLQPMFALNYIDSSYSNYYYGVKNNESNFEREYYKPKGSFYLSSELMGVYMLNEKISLVALYEINGLSQEVKDSPIVDDKIVQSFLLGCTYKF